MSATIASPGSCNITTSSTSMYGDLPGADKDSKEKIHRLFTDIGAVNFYNILWTGPSIRQQGKEIEYIHPLPFLEYLFSNTDMQIQMKNIFDECLSMKKYGFMQNLVFKLNKEMEKNKLLPYVEVFAKKLGISESRIKPFIENRRWSELLDFLIEQKC